MPIFARRRLRSMLNELSKHMNAAKTNDLSARLEHCRTGTALAAEAELSMLWSISRVAHLTIEPTLPGSNRHPDASTNNLFGSGSAVVEVRALSDDNFSGKEAMDRTANSITNYANHLCRGAGGHLTFEFLERSYWDNKGFHRKRCVDLDFKLTTRVKQQLKEWIVDKNWPTPDRIRITERKTDVVVSSHKTEPNLHFRVSYQMPPVAYHLEDNPIYKALKKKGRQVKAGAGILRAVFLVDAGCELLRRLRPMGATVGLEVTGEAIIWHALRKLHIDVVCVFSPYREQQVVFSAKPRIFWKATYFDRREGIPESEYSRLDQLAAQLPPPRYEGYQARHIHRLGGFSPEKHGWYLATTVTTKGDGTMTIKISSRLLQEKLAGRIDTATFQRHAFGNDRNYFEAELARGRTIQGARFESGGIDEDDDYLVFDMDFDWGANSLKPFKKAPSETK